MNYVITFSIIFISTSSIFATIDSLHQELLLAESNDVKTDLLSKIVLYHQLEGNCDSVYYYSQYFIDKYTNKLTTEMWDIIRSRSRCLYDAKKPSELLKGAEWLKQISTDTPKQAARLKYYLWRYRSKAYRQIDSTILAKNALDTMLYYAIESENEQYMMGAYSDLSIFCSSAAFSNLETAIDYERKAHQIAKKLNKDNKGGFFLQTWITAYNLAVHSRNYEKQDSATYYFEEALSIQTSQPELVPVLYKGKLLIDYGLCLLKKGENKAPLQMVGEALPMIEDSKNEYEHCIALLIAAQIYLGAGLNTKAEAALNTARKYDHLFKERATRVRLYNLLVELERDRNPKKALIYKEKHVVIMDSINEENKAAEIALMSEQFSFEDAKRKLAQQQVLQERKIREQGLQISFGSLIILLASILAFIMYRNKIRQEKINIQLLETQSRLEKSNRNLSRFVHSVSHDIMGKLESMLLAGNVMKANHLQTKESRKYYEHNMTSANWLRTYCIELLSWSDQDLSSWDNDSPVKFNNTNEIVQDLLDAHRLELESYKFDVIIDELPLVQMPKAILQQVFKNLIDNAIKYTKDQSDPRIRISAISEADEWTICIKDNGIGVPKEKHYTIFNSIVDKTSLHGRGLNYIKELLLEQEHMIWVDSNDWRGASFYFTIN